MNRIKQLQNSGNEFEKNAINIIVFRENRIDQNVSRRVSEPILHSTVASHKYFTDRISSRNFIVIYTQYIAYPTATDFVGGLEPWNACNAEASHILLIKQV